MRRGFNISESDRRRILSLHNLITEETKFNVTVKGTIKNTFDEPLIDKQFIKIAIENLGWLNKNTITGFLSNWIGDPYRSEPFIRNWRNYHYWDRYDENQISIISNLCTHLCESYSIPKKIVPSQGYLENAVNFDGVVCKSNFSNIYTDINPSFNFRQIFKHEQ